MLNEQLAGQSLFDHTLVKDRICTLWFAADVLLIYLIFVRGREVLAKSIRQNKTEPCVPQQHNIGLAAPPKHYPPTVTSIDSISSEDRTKFHFSHRCLWLLFALYVVGDEVRQCRGTSPSQTVGMEFPGVCDSRNLGRVKRLASTPDVIAMPIFPHTSYYRRSKSVRDTWDGRTHTHSMHDAHPMMSKFSGTKENGYHSESLQS